MGIKVLQDYQVKQEQRVLKESMEIWDLPAWWVHQVSQDPQEILETGVKKETKETQDSQRKWKDGMESMVPWMMLSTDPVNLDPLDLQERMG
jgi:hypothetical protein